MGREIVPKILDKKEIKMTTEFFGEKKATCTVGCGKSSGFIESTVG